MAYSQPGPGEVWKLAEDVKKRSPSWAEKSPRKSGFRNAVDWMYGDQNGNHKHPFNGELTKTPPNMETIAKVAEEAKKAAKKTLAGNAPIPPEYCNSVRRVLTWVSGYSGRPKI